MAGVERAIAVLRARGERFELVFVDAPYRDDRSAAVLRALAEGGLLGVDAYVVVRQAGRAPEISPAGLEAINCATLGDHRIALYRAPAAR